MNPLSWPIRAKQDCSVASLRLEGSKISRITLHVLATRDQGRIQRRPFGALYSARRTGQAQKHSDQLAVGRHDNGGQTSCKCRKSVRWKQRRSKRRRCAPFYRPPIFLRPGMPSLWSLRCRAWTGNNIDVNVENGVLMIEGRIDFGKYEGLQPVCSEYNIGPFRRSFRISSRIDQDKIRAEMRDGVIRLTLPKAEEAKPRRIEVRTC
jgi:hypothetical protein